MICNGMAIRYKNNASYRMGTKRKKKQKIYFVEHNFVCVPILILFSIVLLIFYLVKYNSYNRFEVFIMSGITEPVQYLMGFTRFLFGSLCMCVCVYVRVCFSVCRIYHDYQPQ